MGCSLPGSFVHGISLARILEWVAISFSRRSSQPRDRTCISCLAGEFFTTEPPGKPNNIFTWSYFFNLQKIRYLNQSLIWLLFLLWLRTSFPVKWFEATVGVWETWLTGSWFGDIACLFGFKGSIYVVFSLLCAELTYYWLSQCRNVSQESCYCPPC